MAGQNDNEEMKQKKNAHTQSLAEKQLMITEKTLPLLWQQPQNETLPLCDTSIYLGAQWASKLCTGYDTHFSTGQ